MRRPWTRIGLLLAAVFLMTAVGLRVAGAAPGDGAVLFQGGVAVVEAENHDVKVARSSHDWTTVAGPAGAVGSAIQATPDTGARITGSIPTTSPEVGYRVVFPAAGTYHLWVRTFAVSNGNTFHAGRDGQVTAQGVSAPVGSWSWVKTALAIPSAGEHTVQLWMREDGLYADRVVLAQSSTFTPTGTGPAVTPRQTTGPDITPPSLTGRQPAPGATGVNVGANAVATFSEAMDPATLTAAAVTLAPTAGGAALSAIVTPSAGNTVATLDPVADLAPATAYTVTVAGSVADAAGNPMGPPQTWSFTTAPAAPGPAAGAVLFASGLAVVEAEDFDAKVARSSHDWVAGQSPAGAVAGALKAAPDTGARISAQIPTSSPELAYRVHFPAAGTYQLWVRTYAISNGNTFHEGRDGAVTASNVSASVGSWAWVKQAFAVPSAGEHSVHLWMREDGFSVDRLLLAQSASYTPSGTGPAVTGRMSGDTTAPTLNGRQPAPGATGVAIGADVVATFSEAMSPATLTGTTFTLAPTAGGPAVTGTIAASAGNTVFTLNPGSDLAFSTSYTATVTTGASDAAGNALAAQQSWSFTTAPAPDTTAPTLTGRLPASGATGVAIGADVVATFSEAMNPATLSASTFTLVPTAGGPAVSASIAASAGNTTFTLSPSADLGFATSYTATVTTGAADAAGNPIAAQQTWSFTTAAAPDTTAPTLTGRVPAPGATGVAIAADVVATFSEAMNPATLSASTFTLAPTAGGPAVSAAIAPSAGNTVFTLNPGADLAFATSYTATVTTGATDAAGNPIAAQQTWSFTTAPAPDTTPPTLTGRLPAPGATGVAIGANVVATFSEAMSAATLSASTFTLAPTAAGSAVSATMTPSSGNTVFTLDPGADLAFETSYTATVTTGATDAAGNPIAAQQTWSFTTAPAPDTTAPTLTDRQPAPGAAAIAIGTTVVATFSEAMNPATLTGSTFTLAPTAGGPAVSATIASSADNTTFTLDPAADLGFATGYTATVTTGATDAAGNPIAAQQTWSFTTAPAPDTTAPTLTGRQPAAGATGVAIGTTVVATFSEAMNPATLTGSTFTLAPTAGGPAVSATIASSAGNTAFTLDPAADLAFATSYTATVTTGAADAAGNPLAAQQTWAFTTAPAPDTTAPTLTTRIPAPGAVDVAAGSNVVATFSEAMNPATLTASTFTLTPTAGGPAVGATITPSGGNTTFTLNPSADLGHSTSYTATVTTGATDAAGNPIAAPQTWSFTTAAQDGAILFQNGMAVIEAEDYDVKTPRSSHDWVAGQSPAGSVGGALQAVPDNGSTVSSGSTTETTAAELAYRVRFPAAGTYYVWLRAYAPNSSGNSAHTGLDGDIQIASDELSTNVIGSWDWFSSTLSSPGTASVSVATPGIHTVHVWMREDGMHLDRLLLTPESTFHPTGDGPPASPRDSSGADIVSPRLVGAQPADGATGVALDADVVATFSEAMDPETLTAATVALSPTAGGAEIPASLGTSASGDVLTLNPSASLRPHTSYTVRITAGAGDVAGNALSPTVTWTFTTGAPPGDAVAPTITGRTPASGATGVATGASVAVTFSEAMDPATATGGGLTLLRSAGGTEVPATIAASGDGRTFTLTPAGDLAAGVAYTAAVSTDARDVAGNPLAAASSWSFTTAPAPAGGGSGAGPVLFAAGTAVIEPEDFDQRIPRAGDDWVAGQSPEGFVGDALEVSPDNGSGSSGDIASTAAELSYVVRFPAPGTYRIWVRGYAPDGASNSLHTGLDHVLQETSDSLSTNTFGTWLWFQATLNGPGPAAVTVPTAGDHTFHVWMREDGFHLDRILITTSTSNTPPAGTGPPASARADAGADTTPPTTIDRAPVTGAPRVPQGSDVVASFSEVMDPASVTPATVSLAPAAGGAAVPAAVGLSPDGRSAVIDPDQPLQATTTYRATVTTGVTDLAGNHLAAEQTWTFTTRAREQYEPADGRILSGASTRGLDENLEAFLAVSQQPSIAVHNRYNRRGDPSGFRVPLDEAQEKGVTPMISWAFFQAPNVYSPTQPGANHASIARGDIDGYFLDRAAEVRAYGKPVFLRVHWEMNHDFFAWSVYDGNGDEKAGNSHAEFRSSWRRAVILFRGGTRGQVNAALAAAGLPGLTTPNTVIPPTPNVAWVWTPGSSTDSFDDVHEYWPGDDYIDWAGVDWYPFGSADAGHVAARAGQPSGPNEIYVRYSGPSSRSSKPFLIGEWGVLGQDRPSWTADMFEWFETHPQTKAQLYFNIAASDSNSQLQDFPLSAAAFRAGVSDGRWITDWDAVGGPLAPPAP